MKAVKLGSGPWQGMHTLQGDGAEVADPGTVHYAVNVLPARLPAAGGYRTRAGLYPTGLNALVQIADSNAGGWLGKAGGTILNWLLDNGQLYDLGPILAGPQTLLVTDTQLATAGILIGTTVKWTRVAGGVIFADATGVQKPWFWDGTAGAGGLLPLTNAPLTYGSPTYYAGRAFFISAADRRTIVWSEPGQYNTGYQANPFDNSWTLFQSGQAGLEAIHGGFAGLAYWRHGVGVGLIRGSGTDDDNFRSTATLDAILPDTAGLGAAGQVAEYNGRYFWRDSEGKLWRMESDGSVVPLPLLGVEWSPGGIGREPFGYEHIGPDIGNTASLDAVAMPPTPATPYWTIWLGVQANLGSALVAFLVVAPDTGRVLGWVSFDPGTGPTFTGMNRNPMIFSGFGSSVRTDLAAGFMVQGATSGKRLALLADTTSNADLIAFSGDNVPIASRLILHPLGGPDAAAGAWNVQDLYVAGVGGPSGFFSATVALLSDIYPTAAASPPSGVVQGVAANAPQTVVARLGYRDQLRWLRPSFSQIIGTIDRVYTMAKPLPVESLIA